MKTIYLNSTKILLAFLICLSSTYAFTQSSAALLPYRIGLCTGDTVHVPIHLTGLDIFQMDFYIDYNHTVLTPHPVTPYTNLTSGFTATLTDPFGGFSNILRLVILKIHLPGLDFTGEKIIDLVFIYNGGSATMHLRNDEIVESLSSA